MPKLSFSDVRLNYDPSEPQQRFRDAGLEAAFAKPSAQLPSAPPWPAGGAPQPISLTPIPTPSDDLSRFQGYDAVVVTWTAAEAAALAARGLEDRLPAMKAVGLRELAAFARGETSHAEALTAAQAATRQYAKRQTTWFRNQTPDWPRLEAVDFDDRWADFLTASA